MNVVLTRARVISTVAGHQAGGISGVALSALLVRIPAVLCQLVIGEEAQQLILTSPDVL